MRITLIRHAQSMGNRTGDYSHLQADSLSETGRGQAWNLAVNLASEPFDKIIVSPLARTLETAVPYLERTDQYAEIWPEIAEMRWQKTHEPRADDWCRETCSPPSDLPERFTFYENRKIKPAATPPETNEEQRCRLYIAKERILNLQRQGYASVLFISHGIFVRELICALLNLPGALSFPTENCAAHQLLYDEEEGWRVIYLNRLPALA
ncbi:MAG: histidine phosphatase family protein [Verrucomicrobia bacterium]|nr:histidine phosphatase family protein [Verrucomicrobiota bacterium]MCH8512721.1 histidine phosphatase family protein [Kiritimatiellia bacterium]